MTLRQPSPPRSPTDRRTVTREPLPPAARVTRPALPPLSGGPVTPLPAASPSFGQGLPPRRRPPARSPIIAPALALVGLVFIGAASFWGISLLGLDGDVGARGAAPSGEAVAVLVGDPGESAEPRGPASPDPDDVAPTLDATLDTPPPDQRPSITGTILFSRGGEIWAASGLDLAKLTSNGSDSMPAWGRDGESIFFIRTQVKTVKNSCPGGKYTFYMPNVMTMNANGGRQKPVYKSLIKRPTCQWFSHVLQPDVSPDGKTLVVVSDGPSGSGSVTLHTLPAKGGRLEPLRIRSIGDLGHNDPAWSPDRKRLAFTHNRASGTEGVPQVAVYTRKSRRVNYLQQGYANPSWSPDSRWLAAERTTGSGRDIVILDPQRGFERARLTNDGHSFAPAVSPDGDQIAYLERDGLGIDLRVMTLAFGEDGSITLVDDRAVTDDGSIDASSPPAWHIPTGQLTNAPQPEAEAPLADRPSSAGQDALGQVAP
ncbi:hypothetical protein BH23CHL8_BH23CHL8_13020 [soil metagenome]